LRPAARVGPRYHARLSPSGAGRAAPGAALVLFAATFALTIARGLRWPNDFAEAH
jgi:hypothetical protein